MFQVSFCSNVPIAPGDNDVCSIQANNKTTTAGKTLPVTKHIYNTQQQGNQQNTQPQKKQ
eukprot:12171342-Ditylum_brightwellii.AAC.1